jgi:integrase/recombinase XerD
VEAAHAHVQRRDNLNGAWAKSRRSRAVPLDFLVVQAIDQYAAERAAPDDDFLLVNLFRAPIGAPVRTPSTSSSVRYATAPGWAGT